MYQFHNNILSIPAKLLYNDWGLMTYDNYLKLANRGKLVRSRKGKGSDSEALLSVYDLPVHNGLDYKAVCYQKLGNPKEVAIKNILEQYILPDAAAAQYFLAHRKPNDKPFSKEIQIEKTTNACILNALKMVLKDSAATHKVFGKNKIKLWHNISEAVNAIDADKWHFNLPSNERSLKRKFLKYQKEGYSVFISGLEGKQNAQKIKGDVADYVLATYCLPNKLSVPMLLAKYNAVKQDKGWGNLSDRAINLWLNEPAQKRIWMLARHGKETYNKHFKHTLSKDKSAYFPNSYWAIDGSKLDWIRFNADATNKMSADLKENLIFDTYSEMIIGYSIGFTESHIEHFKALRMAVNTAGCRPFIYV